MTDETLRESEARQGKEVAEGTTGWMMAEDAKVCSNGEAGAGLEVDEMVGGGEGRTRGRHAVDVALHPVWRGGGNGMGPWWCRWSGRGGRRTA